MNLNILNFDPWIEKAPFICLILERYHKQANPNPKRIRLFWNLSSFLQTLQSFNDHISGITDNFILIKKIVTTQQDHN